ncbi:DUF1242-domain-containing protein [Neocallimastix californiae]|uniref:Protein kish n=1 Tax=Neocallimastix californiae TaxID=1754190 RepID=A0A1Y2CA57_9FUNG|nr:DUF1242-domain-containing protein [Neocallimastix californiae]|eukprot:ORY43215.1 DUF1242-domain-containing protein [Neocallimastix californiae]
MSALFNFQSLLLVIIFMICTCTYVRAQFPSVLDKNKTGLSPYVSLCCIIMAVSLLFQ